MKVTVPPEKYKNYQAYPSQALPPAPFKNLKLATLPLCHPENKKTFTYLFTFLDTESSNGLTLN